MESKDTVLYLGKFSRYRVFFKKVLHKREEKMQEEMKKTLLDENLVQVHKIYF